jgi:hypothetical protein
MANRDILFHPVKRGFIVIPISVKKAEQETRIKESSKAIFFNLHLRANGLSLFSESSPEMRRNKQNTLFLQKSGEF